MNPKVTAIASRDNELIRRLRGLQSRAAAYRQSGSFWVEGEHLCRAALERGIQPVQAVIEESAWRQDPNLAQLARQSPRVAVVPAALMAAVSGLESPAPIGFLLTLPESALAPQPLNTLGPRQNTGPSIPVPAAATGRRRVAVAAVVLDRLQDPGNVGSILRSAAAMGVPQVVALSGTVALWSPKVLRAGMGAHFSLSLRESATVGDLLPWQSALVATSSHEAQPLPLADLPDPCVWVFGHEGAGVAPELLAMAARRVRIPQPGGQESLNVAAAAAICLYESVRAAADAGGGAAMPQ